MFEFRKWRLRLPFAATSMTGVDIQSSEIRIAQLTSMGDGYRVDQAAAVSLPDGVILEGRIRDWRVITEVLSGLVSDCGLQGESAVVAMPASLVRMQCAMLPCGIPRDAVEAEIQALVQEDFPGMREALYVDYRVRQETHDGDLDVLYAAARRDDVMQYANAVTEAGLNVKIADIDIYALLRVLGYDMASDSLEGVYAAVWVARASMSILIVLNDEILFHQCWARKDAHENLTQLSARIHRFNAVFPGRQIKLLGCYSPGRELESLLSAQADPCQPEIRNLYPFGRLQPGPHLRVTWDQENVTDYFIAFGAAMREVPQWRR